MRAFVLALTLCSVATSARAENDLELAPVSRYEEARRLADAHDNAILLRNAGIVLSLLGTALTVAGSYEAFHGALCDSCGADTFSAGVGVLAVGQGAAIAGITTWIAGGLRAARVDRAQVTASAGGLKVTF